ncbi:MAG: hypothetical protein U0X91_20575 [Spirosomataceae bacterium]
MDKRKILEAVLNGDAAQLQKLVPVYNLEKLTTEQLFKLRSHEARTTLLSEDDAVIIADSILNHKSGIKTRQQKIKLIQRLFSEVVVLELIKAKFPYLLMFSEGLVYSHGERINGKYELFFTDIPKYEEMRREGNQIRTYSITEERFLVLKAFFLTLPQAQRILDGKNGVYLGFCSLTEESTLKRELENYL